MSSHASLQVKNEFLEKTTLASLLSSASATVVSIPSTATHKDALELLAKHNFTSMPVTNDKGEFVGIVNLQDLLFPVLFKCTKEELEADVSATTEEELSKKLLLDLPVAQFLGISEESKTVWRYTHDTPLGALLNAMASGVHRALVTDGSGGTHVITQTDVGRFLYAHRDQVGGKLGGVMKAPVSQLMTTFSTSGREVVTVAKSDAVYQAFRKLCIHEVSAAPVVDSQGQVVATVGLSDLRGLNASNAKDLLLDTTSFFKLRHPTTPASPGVICVPSDPLEKVMKEVVDHHVHRAWVVEQAGKPTNVLSLTDIFMLVVVK